jgi:hypothetical protein
LGGGLSVKNSKRSFLVNAAGAVVHQHPVFQDTVLVSGSQQDDLETQLKKLNQKGTKSRVQELMLQDDLLFSKTKASLYGDQNN